MRTRLVDRLRRLRARSELVLILNYDPICVCSRSLAESPTSLAASQLWGEASRCERVARARKRNDDRRRKSSLSAHSISSSLAHAKGVTGALELPPIRKHTLRARRIFAGGRQAKVAPAHDDSTSSTNANAPAATCASSNANYCTAIRSLALLLLLHQYYKRTATDNNNYARERARSPHLSCVLRKDHLSVFMRVQLSHSRDNLLSLSLRAVLCLFVSISYLAAHWWSPIFSGLT